MIIDSFKNLRLCIDADLYRYFTHTGFRCFVRGWFIPGFRFMCLMRTTQYLSNKNFPVFPLYLIFRLMLRHYQFKYGISIHHTTDIGPGLYIGHFGGIVVNPESKIGANCNLSPNILLGLKYSAKEQKFKYPVLGDRVFVGNGAKILGASVGDDACIGVGSIVTSDVASNTTVAGNPAHVINNKGSQPYVGSYK